MDGLRSIVSWRGRPPAGGPVALFLHGYGTDEYDLPPLAARVLPAGSPWASLRAPVPLATGGAAWYPIVEPGRPDPTAIARAREAVWAWVDAALPDRRLVPIGFSQGGLMVTELLRSRPERLAAGAVLSGFVAEGERADDSPGSAAVPVFWGHGDVDPVVAPIAAERTAEWLPRHARLVERVYPGLGHAISPAEARDLEAFLRGALGERRRP